MRVLEKLAGRRRFRSVLSGKTDRAAAPSAARFDGGCLQVKTVAGLLGGILIMPGATAQSLQDVVRRTIETNPEVLAAGNRQFASEAEVKQALARYYPSLDFEGATGYEWSKNASLNDRVGGDSDEDLWRNEAELRLTQLIYDGLETPMAIKQARAGAAERAYSVQEIAEEVGLRTGTAFLDVLRRIELRELARDNLDAHERTLNQIQSRVQQGVSREADLDQAKARLALSESNLVVTENNLLDSRAAYEVVVGEQPEDLDDPPDLSALIAPTLAESLTIADQSSPTIRLASQQIAGAQAQRRGAKSGFFPQLTAEVGRSWDDNIDGQRGSDEDFTALLRLRWNLFRGGADEARSEQANFILEQAQNAQSQACRRMREKVQLAWAGFSTLSRQMRVLNDAARFADDTKRAYQQQFNIGQRTLLDLLDSENEVFTTRTSLAEAQFDREIAALELLEAMGTLLESLEVPMPEAGRIPEEVRAQQVTCEPQEGAAQAATSTN